MSSEVRYVTGKAGVRIVGRDGSHTDVPPRSVVRLDPHNPPARIIGRLYRLSDNGGLAYEAPDLQPERTSL